MGMMKNYLLKLQEQCSVQQFGQDAIEYAVMSGALQLTYNLPTDLHQIFDRHSNCCDAPPRGELDHNHTGRCRQCGEGAIFTTHYEDFCEGWRRQCQANEEALAASYEQSGLLEEILRPVPLALSVSSQPEAVEK